jgi:hypothetical protein
MSFSGGRLGHEDIAIRTLGGRGPISWSRRLGMVRNSRGLRAYRHGDLAGLTGWVELVHPLRHFAAAHMGGAGHHHRRHISPTAPPLPTSRHGRPGGWEFLGPSGGDNGAWIIADPTTAPAAISLAPTTPALSRGNRASCGALAAAPVEPTRPCFAEDAHRQFASDLDVGVPANWRQWPCDCGPPRGSECPEADTGYRRRPRSACRSVSQYSVAGRPRLPFCATVAQILSR